MSRYVISDLHLDHENIIEYCDREFKTVSEMNTALVNNWNNTISNNGDQVIFVGDLCMTHEETTVIDWLEQLNYASCIFVEGNHDPINETLESKIASRQYHYIEHENMQFCVSHYPRKTPSDWSGWIIHGHTHNNEMEKYPFINQDEKTVNVSAELVDYTPIKLQTIVKAIRSENSYDTINDVPTEL